MNTNLINALKRIGSKAAVKSFCSKVTVAKDAGTSEGAKKGWAKRLRAHGDAPEIDYSSYKSKIGKGIHTWQKGDTSKPTGPVSFPVFHYREETPEILAAISRCNSKVPRVGGRIDPWHQAKVDFLRQGGVIENWRGDAPESVNYGFHTDKEGRGYSYSHFIKGIPGYAEAGTSVKHYHGD